MFNVILVFSLSIPPFFELVSSDNRVGWGWCRVLYYTIYCIYRVGWCHILLTGGWNPLGDTSHHASEGQRMTLVGVNLLELLLMTTAAPAKRYLSMIMRGLCHKSAWPVQPSKASYWLADWKWWHKPLMIIHMYCLTGAAVVIGSCSRIQLRLHHSHHHWPEPVWLPYIGLHNTTQHSTAI